MSAMLPRLFDDSVFDVFDPFADFAVTTASLVSMLRT